MSPLPGLLLKGKNEGKYNLERAGCHIKLNSIQIFVGKFYYYAVKEANIF
jgi:hypothetical protein